LQHDSFDYQVRGAASIDRLVEFFGDQVAVDADVRDRSRITSTVRWSRSRDEFDVGQSAFLDVLVRPEFQEQRGWFVVSTVAKHVPPDNAALHPTAHELPTIHLATD